MSIYALIDLSQASGDILGIVVNIIEGADLPENFSGPGFDVEPCDDTVEIGDGWDGDDFIPPLPTTNELKTELQIQLINYMAAYTFSGYSFDLGDSGFRDWITDAYLIAKMQSSSASHSAPQADGSYVSITNANIILLYKDFCNYLQKGMDAAAIVYANIVNTTITTLAGVDGAWSTALSGITVPTTNDKFSAIDATLSSIATEFSTDETNIATNTTAISSLNTAMTAANTAIASKLGSPNAPTNLTLSLVTSTASGGTQPSSSKPFTLVIDGKAASTATIGGSATGAILLEVCATNSATPADWVEVGRIGSDQTITLAIALQSIQSSGGSITMTLPSGYYIRARDIGTGTHTETLVKATVTTYG